MPAGFLLALFLFTFGDILCVKSVCVYRVIAVYLLTAAVVKVVQ